MTKKIKKIMGVGLSLFTLGQMSNVMAHVSFENDLYSGFSDSPVAYGAADVWEVTCSGGSDRLVLSVLDTESGRSKVSALAYKDKKAANTIDSRGGNSTASPFVRVNAGDGIYTIIVTQSLPGINYYILEYHCETSTGTHTTTSQVPEFPLQDQ